MIKLVFKMTNQVPTTTIYLALLRIRQIFILLSVLCCLLQHEVEGVEGYDVMCLYSEIGA